MVGCVQAVTLMMRLCIGVRTSSLRQSLFDQWCRDKGYKPLMLRSPAKTRWFTLHLAITRYVQVHARVEQWLQETI